MVSQQIVEQEKARKYNFMMSKLLWSYFLIIRVLSFIPDTGKILINILNIMNMEYQDAILLSLKDK